MSAILTFLAAFEFVAADPASAGRLAATAGGDWRAGLNGNPALLWSYPEMAAAAAFTRPYNLPGLGAGRLDAKVRPGSAGFDIGLGLASTALEKYQEHDLAVGAAREVLAGVAVGIAVHGLAQVWAGEATDLLAAVDAGVTAELGSLRLGFAGRRLNVPRLRDESELPLLIAAGGSWQPVSDLVLALDLRREGSEESVGLGAELRLIPQLRLRAGLATTPLRYAGGLGVSVGPVVLDYAWQFHPQLKETHLVGAEVRWR